MEKADAQTERPKPSVRKKNKRHRVKGNDEGTSFEWFPKAYERWQNKELMKFIEKSPEHLGKLEEELKSSADVQIQTDHVIVTVKNTKTPRNWKQRCEKELEMFFKDFSVQSLYINKELEPSLLRKEYNTEVTKLWDDGRGLLVSVSGCAKDVEKKMFDLREQNKMQSSKKDAVSEDSSCQSVRRKKKQKHENNAAARNRSQSVPRKLQNKPPPLMQVNLQKQESFGPSYGPRPLMPRPQLRSFTHSQFHPFRAYHTNAMQPGHDFHQPVISPDHAVYPISIKPQHLGRFNDKLLQEIRSSTYNMSITWQAPLRLELSGPSREIEKAMDIINSRVWFQETKNIFCQKWVFEALNHKIVEAHADYPELKIWFERDSISIVGHPTEVEPVHNRLEANAKEFFEKYLDVPKETHGLIIGKKGQKIELLQSKYKVSIVIPPSNAEASSIRIRGKISDVKNAAAEILNLIKQFRPSVKIVNFPSWLYSHLEIFVKEGQGKWKEVKTETLKDKITLTGPGSKIELFYIFLEEKISELARIKTITVQSWMKKYIIGKERVHIREIEQHFPQVKIEILKAKFKIIGSTEFLEKACSHLQRRIDEVKRSYKVISIPMEANQMHGVIGHHCRNQKKLEDEFEVNLRSTSNPITLCIEGLVEKVEKAHVHIVVKVQNLITFCILQTRIPPDQMGRFIGKGGSNLDRLKSIYTGVTEIVTRQKGQPNDVLLMGDRANVDLLQDHLSSRYNAVTIGYSGMDHSGSMHSKNRENLYGSYGNLTMKTQTLSEAGSDFDDGLDDTEQGVDTFLAESTEREIAVIYSWKDAETALLRFVATSEVHLKKLKANFQDFESVVIAEDKKIFVAGRSNPSAKQQWIDKTRSNLKTFFGNYASCAVSFDQHSTVDRSDCHEENASILWNEEKSKVVVSGLKERVDKISEEYAKILTKTKSVSVKVSVNKYIIQFVKESSAELIKFQNMFKDSSVAGSTIEVKAEIPEIRSETEWQQESEREIESFFAQYECKEISVPLVHAGEFRSLCDEQERLVIRWDNDRHFIIIYGMKFDVDIKAKELEIKLDKIKNKEVRVSYEHHVVDPDVFKFVKDLQSHTEKLVKTLGELGSPVLIDQKVIVYSEISKTSSVHRWEQRCGTKISEFFAGYKSLKIPVPDEKCHHAVRMTNTRQSAVTKWIPAESCLQVCGAKNTVAVTKSFILKQLDKMEGSVSNSGMNPSVGSVSKDIEVKKYGAYEFLNEQIGVMNMSCGIKHHCKMRLERMRDEIYGEQNFICIPPLENNDEPQGIFGNLDVTVEEGDITEVDVDVIVNTTDKSFSFCGPLSQSILSKGGIQLSECHQHDTDMRITCGGTLKCKEIFHVAIPSKNESMSSLIQKVLKKAEELKYSSIALPTIGAGGGGWSCKEVSAKMKKGILNFVIANPNLKHLRTIKVILFDKMHSEDKKPFYCQLLVDDNSRSERDTFRSKFTTKGTKLSSRSNTGDRDKADIGAGKFAKIIITSNSKENAEAAETEIDKFLSLHMKEVSLYNSSISRLKKPQIDKILQIVRDKKIRIIVNRTKNVHKIHIQGVGEDVATVEGAVQKIVSEISIDFPETWDPMSENLMRVKLRPTSKEYITVKEKFVEANKSRNRRFNITKVERLQNKELYRYYAIKKETVSKDAQILPFERQLFHGTSSVTIDLICEHGFDKCYAGKNATRYGNGTYFSTESSYSDAYTKEASDNTRQMFLANVLTGDFCQGYQGLPAPPQNPSTGRPYHSVVDSVRNPTMFVVFKDPSTYPSYVISYTREKTC